MWKWALLGLCAVVAAQSEEWRELNIAQGPVRGRIDPEGGVYSFFNIPYATVPTGIHKFKAPMAGPAWMQMFDAVDRGIRCPQPGSFAGSTMQEQCLVANVFVPDTDKTNLRVLVHIHDGSHNVGIGTSRTFNALVQTKEIIVVTFNYRLSIHGFLCLRTENAPGNAGTKDQIALLRWVNANIASFGGNPDDVTIVGCSAGSGSVDLLTLSGATTGLFKRAILESGGSTGGVGVQTDPIGNAKTYAELLNFNNVDDIASLEEFYTTTPFADLFAASVAITQNENSNVLFAPCLEEDLGQERVIEDNPINIIKRGNYTKIPLLFGFTNYDGSMRIGHWNNWKDRMNEKFSDFLPVELHFDSEAEKEEVAEKVKSFYFQDQPVNEQNIESYIYYFTDVLFGYAMLRSLNARVESLGDLIYLFEYSFIDSNTNSIMDTDLRGAGHCSQIAAVMDQNKTGATEEYIQMKAIMREYWFNFIMTGNPSAEGSTLPSWTPASANRSPYMSLGAVVELKEQLNLEDRVAFWDGIYDQYYRGPTLPASTDGAVPLVISYMTFIVAVIVNII